MKKRLLVLENGRYFLGDAFGADGTKISEIVFNTSMVGYQEILSDPSYCDQMVVMSYPLIGNYGLADDDYESHGVYLDGFIVREYNDSPSNFRSSKTLAQAMEDYGVIGISGVDTREIVRIIRDEGTMKAMLTDGDRDVEECLKELKGTQLKNNQVERVSSKRVWFSRTKNPEFTVGVIDCGVKLSTINKLKDFGCNVIVYPYDVTVEEILKSKLDGLVVSNGPGNPESVMGVVQTVKQFIGKLPIMGFCLGYQIVALAYGVKINKMKFGHRGANQPVKNLFTDKVEVTTQNHSFAIDKESVKNTSFEITHVNILDGDVEGMIDRKNKVVGIQFQPDSAVLNGKDYLFNEYIEFLKSCGGNKYAKENRY